MNQNYPEHIIRNLRELNGLDEQDLSMDAEFQEMSPEEVFDQILKFNGIVGYRYTILRWITDIFKVKLDIEGDKQSRKDFVQGLGNIFRAQKRSDEISALRMEPNHKVTVYFKDGSRTVDCSLGNKAELVSDSTKQII